MNKKQIELLKKKLEEDKESLQGTLQRFAKENDKLKGDWKTVYPDFNPNESGLEEEADEVEEYSTLLKVEHALEIKLKNINRALGKMKEGNYGLCEKCGEEIPYEKLSLVPETKICTNCT